MPDTREYESVLPTDEAIAERVEEANARLSVTDQEVMAQLDVEINAFGGRSTGVGVWEVPLEENVNG